MINFFHKLFNPHCEQCALESQEKRVCLTCEEMRSELIQLRMEKDRLLDHILNPKSDIPIASVNQEELKPIMPATIPWHIRRKMLEEQDRANARAKQNAAQPDVIKSQIVVQAPSTVIANEAIEELESALLAEGSD